MKAEHAKNPYAKLCQSMYLLPVSPQKEIIDCRKNAAGQQPGNGRPNLESEIEARPVHQNPHHR